MTALDNAYKILFSSATLILAFCILLCMIRGVIGPRITNRVIAINMIGTLTISIIAILSVLREESYLADISLIYAMLSFVSVIVLVKIDIGVYLEKKNQKEEKK